MEDARLIVVLKRMRLLVVWQNEARALVPGAYAPLSLSTKSSSTTNGWDLKPVLLTEASALLLVLQLRTHCCFVCERCWQPLR
jgi:hypothetical protein